MLEHSTFTVASPEAAAAILWRDASKAPAAAQNMKITAQDLRQLKLADGIIPEPTGGAHRDHPGAAQRVAGALTETLDELADMPTDRLLEQRHAKYRDLGFFLE
jgi:acetyl-CoA carboxylase carboxyl transferase subunit alpha